MPEALGQCRNLFPLWAQGQGSVGLHSGWCPYRQLLCPTTESQSEQTQGDEGHRYQCGLCPER